MPIINAKKSAPTSKKPKKLKSGILNVGDTAEVLWDDGRWYKATVTEKDNSHMVFDYGNEELYTCSVDFLQTFQNITKNANNDASDEKRLKLEPSNSESAAPLQQPEPEATAVRSAPSTARLSL